MKAAVIIFPGSNCDRDMIQTIANHNGQQPELVWHADTKLPAGLDVIALPGGFSYGDYLRSGAMAARSPIMQEVIAAAKRGVYILGVCNGFQILTESGLLPGALIRNQNLKFVCKSVSLKAANTDTIFTSGYHQDTSITIPVAHHDGNYFADDETLHELEQEDRIAFYYDKENPNGSADNIAGIFDTNKRILGMMPHPERACDKATGSTDGAALFDSLFH